MNHYRLIAATLLPLTACDETAPSAPAPPAADPSGTLTLAAEETADFLTATVVPKIDYTFDLYVSSGGDKGAKLSPGGPNPAEYRPVNWFGGESFASLAQVPSEKPTAASGSALVHAAAGDGFVLQNHAGRWTRGFVSAASSLEVTIAFEPLSE